MRARASLFLVALLVIAVGAGLAPASGESPTARPSAYKLIETFTFLPNAEVTAKTRFQAAEDYAIVMRGTIESWNDGMDYRSQWDPWYLYGCTGSGCGDAFAPSKSHRPVAFDRRTGQYAALSNLGSGSSIPPYNPDHGYRLLVSDFGGELTLRDRLGPFNDHHAGSFTFQIYEKTATPTVEFDFLQNNLRGAVETTTRGRGKFKLRRRPDLRNGKRSDTVLAIDPSVDALELRHRDEYVVSDDDILHLDIKRAKYSIEVTDRAVYERIVFGTRVAKSNDPDCPEGTGIAVVIEEAKGARGKGKVRIVSPPDDSRCRDHDHRAFTKRDREDTVRVAVKGPKPLR